MGFAPIPVGNHPVDHENEGGGMVEPGLDLHEWQTRWEELQEMAADEPARALPEIVRFVRHVLEDDRRFDLSNEVAEEGEDPEIVRSFLAAEDLAGGSTLAPRSRPRMCKRRSTTSARSTSTSSPTARRREVRRLRAARLAFRFGLAALEREPREVRAADCIRGKHGDTARSARPERRLASAVAQDGELAEQGAGAHARDGLAVDLDVEHSVQQQEHVAPRLALLDQGLAGVEPSAG